LQSNLTNAKSTRQQSLQTDPAGGHSLNPAEHLRRQMQALPDIESTQPK